ncbi:hypothetical protein PoB_005857200 [Plakobranchus ocellatus]|uniref:Uncharacterized protein n=1 Tax=Plakobranchus ocellatus TaxID=259542 RepID=A0AAV4CK30_9GAST|nr:hypothetical protein PoB_005857200 [Plakobranchus ocellatus]
MDQSVIHHPLEGLTQAARERNRPIVEGIRGILPGFGIGTTEASLQDGRLSPVVQMLLKSLRRSLPTVLGISGHSCFTFCPIQGFFATSDCGEGSGFLFLFCFVFFFGCHDEVFIFSSTAPHPPPSPTKGTRCAALQRCARAILELYSQQRVWDLYWEWDRPKPNYVGRRCPPVSGEGNRQRGMLMSVSHYCRAVTTSTPKIHPSPHTGRTSRQTRRPHCGVGLSIIPSTEGLRWIEIVDSRRRSRRDVSAGKEVEIEDKS